ncbi:MAG: DUF4931 domain-containing protein [Schwartzia sp.]|nr:DUF4931 domain-containing protein [Schwartzia sp. (in: firmicutes)]
MEINLLHFDPAIGLRKPENIVHRKTPCPFCQRRDLAEIIDEQGEFMLLRNKYNILTDADQFVLLETKRCGRDMPDYTPEHMRALIRFGVRHWRRMQASGEYDMVILYKNHGHFSGGTMRHPHMQIVGFRHIDPTLTLDRDSFHGLPVLTRDGVEITVSTHPRVGFGEFNLIAPEEALDPLADAIQTIVAFIVGYFRKCEDSYNIFFYDYDGRIAVKVMPRFATSPLLIGYGIRLLPASLDKLIRKVRARFGER